MNLPPSVWSSSCVFLGVLYASRRGRAPVLTSSKAKSATNSASFLIMSTEARQWLSGTMLKQADAEDVFKSSHGLRLIAKNSSARFVSQNLNRYTNERIHLKPELICSNKGWKSILAMNTLSSAPIKTGILVLNSYIILTLEDAERLLTWLQRYSSTANAVLIVPVMQLRRRIGSRWSAEQRGRRFQERVEEFIGKEYSVLSSYVDKRTPVKIRHNTEVGGCGGVSEITPEAFTNGRRCPYCHADYPRNLGSEAILTDEGIWVRILRRSRREPIQRGL